MRIYSYDLVSKERQDSHHNDGTKNDDDFILYRSGTSGKIRPYGLWTNGAVLWVAGKPETKNSRERKIYVYSMTWVTADVRDDVGGMERYLTGSRTNTIDFDLVDAGNTEPNGIWSDGATCG